MSKHTPESWFMSLTHNGDAYDIGAEDNSNVALVYANEPHVKNAATGRANARLIIAAPNLLKVLREVAHSHKDGGFIELDADLMSEITVAIAEARRTDA